MEFVETVFRDAVLELVRRTSTDLSEDVVSALECAFDEENDETARGILSQILENVRIARENSTPICQDTGTLIFLVKVPVGVSTRVVQGSICRAVCAATDKSYLRPNAVDPLSGLNSGNNLGVMSPCIHFDEWDRDAIEVRLLLKGGGCENVSCLYKLPDTRLRAGRDLKGVYKCVIDAVSRAQGRGCSPGILGVAVGGDQATGMTMAKEQLFRNLSDHSPDAQLDTLEKRLLVDLNSLGIGPMGLGGRSTVLAVKMTTLHRLPASYFVSIAYMCWANRHRAMLYADEVTHH